MSFLKPFGRRIQSIREKRGLSQEQLEEKIEVNAKYISAIECGQKNITINTLKKIANGLEIELYQLFLFDDDVDSAIALKKIINSLLEEASPNTLKLLVKILILNINR